MVSPDLNIGGFSSHSSQPVQSSVGHPTMAHDMSQLSAGQSYAGVNYVPIQQPPQLQGAPMVAGDVFSNTGAAGSTMLLDTPHGFDYALHEVRSKRVLTLTAGIIL